MSIMPLSVHNVIEQISGEYADVIVVDVHILRPMSTGLVRCVNIYSFHHVQVQSDGFQTSAKFAFWQKSSWLRQFALHPMPCGTHPHSLRCRGNANAGREGFQVFFLLLYDSLRVLKWYSCLSSMPVMVRGAWCPCIRIIGCVGRSIGLMVAPEIASRINSDRFMS